MAESIAPAWRSGDRHVVHVVFGADLSAQVARGHRDAGRLRARPPALRSRRAAGDRPAPADEALRRALAARATRPCTSARSGSPRSARRAPVRARPRDGVRGTLELVGERLELDAAERLGQQPVGEPRVARKQRAVKVRAVDPARPAALEARDARRCRSPRRRGRAARRRRRGSCAPRGSRTRPASRRPRRSRAGRRRSSASRPRRCAAAGAPRRGARRRSCRGRSARAAGSRRRPRGTRRRPRPPRGAGPPFAARSGATSSCSRSWPPPT